MLKTPEGRVVLASICLVSAILMGNRLTPISFETFGAFFWWLTDRLILAMGAYLAVTFTKEAVLFKMADIYKQMAEMGKRDG